MDDYQKELYYEPESEQSKGESIAKILVIVALCIAFMVAGIIIGKTLW